MGGATKNLGDCWSRAPPLRPALCAHSSLSGCPCLVAHPMLLALLNLRGQARPKDFGPPPGSSSDEHSVSRNDSQSGRVLVCQSLRVTVRRSDGLSVCQSHGLFVHQSVSESVSMSLSNLSLSHSVDLTFSECICSSVFQSTVSVYQSSSLKKNVRRVYQPNNLSMNHSIGEAAGPLVCQSVNLMISQVSVSPTLPFFPCVNLSI